jgi:tRNA A37 threonylcarbamoyladenosine biosynthesis protein TsaE
MGLEIDPETVSSPTFVFCHEYHGTRLLYHFDAYRLKSEEEFLQLGVEELFDSDAICVVEWADRICGCLPKEMLEVEIETHLECSDVSPRSVVAEPLLSKPTSALSNCRTIHFRGHGIDLLGFQTRSSGQVPPE